MPTIISDAWTIYLIHPLMEVLVYLEGLVGAGLAIIAFTVLSRVALFPLTRAQLRSTQAMQRLAPQLATLKAKHGKDRERLNTETMALYKEAGVNPAAGCLPLVIQLPIMFALYGALTEVSITPDSNFTRPWLWLEGLDKPDVIMLWGVAFPFILPVLAALTQFVQQQMMTMPTDDPAQRQQQQMMQFMPLMMLWIGTSVSSGLGIYWVTQNVIGIIQQYLTTGMGSLATFRLPGLGSLASLRLPGMSAPAPAATSGGPALGTARDRQGSRAPRADRAPSGGGRRSGGKS